MSEGRRNGFSGVCREKSVCVTCWPWLLADLDRSQQVCSHRGEDTWRIRLQASCPREDDIRVRSTCWNQIVQVKAYCGWLLSE